MRRWWYILKVRVTELRGATWLVSWAEIGVHIVQHTVLKLSTFIAENEALYRKDSEGKSDRMPKTFAKIYSGQPLYLLDFQYFDQGKVAPSAGRR